MNTPPQFTTADLDCTLRRALAMVGIAVVVLAPLFWWRGGWQTAALFGVGALISALGIWEWSSLIDAVGRHFQANPERPPKRTAWVLARFSLRLVLVAVLLYVSLRCLHGSAYALIAGICLAIAALTLQAVLLLNRWS